MLTTRTTGNAQPRWPGPDYCCGMADAAANSVVVGVDGSESALGAARWAADVAAARSLPLTLVHAIPRLDLHFVSDKRADGLHASTDGDAVLDAAATAVRTGHADIQVHTQAVKGAVANVLADAAQSARLLVVGSGEGQMLGGHVGRIVARTSGPVLVWRTPAARRTGKPLPVVVGVDDSEASARALTEAFDIAAALHAPLTVAHMWEIGAAVGMGDLGGAGNMDWQLLEVLESQQTARIEELVAPLTRHYPNAHVSKVFRDISPAKGLVELSRDAQLMVVGSNGRGRLSGAILGSVSQSLIHHAESSVLVVR